MTAFQDEVHAIADHLAQRHAAILLAWRQAIRRDPTISSGDSLPPAELIDHVPGVLVSLEQGIRQGLDGSTQSNAPQLAAAHGLQRWQQGYDLREVTHEWGKLNECVIIELDRYVKANPAVSIEAMAFARGVWTRLCSEGIESSVHQYFTLQQQESAGHVQELESALDSLRIVEHQRNEVWQQAAHDLRGNLGVVANVTVGLTRSGMNPGPQDDFVRILMRNVTSLYQLLDDVTNLARLQAGRETRQIDSIDASTILKALCEDVRPLAQQRDLDLIEEGPAGFAVHGDSVKIRRIAQNLLMNAVKYTRKGHIKVSWGDSAPEDGKRWLLCIQDTGPGFHTRAASAIAEALEPTSGAASASSSDGKLPQPLQGVTPHGVVARSISSESGEGIGLSIVKRLCEMLDATMEMHSVEGEGTTFKIFFPRQYAG
ncbi:MAG TPA: sensor histidine kinase [Steroidobacteraceae bacterium]|nr:sensor histidine kinase [Steroidobacteraceae bacterium]